MKLQRTETSREYELGQKWPATKGPKTRGSRADKEELYTLHVYTRALLLSLSLPLAWPRRASCFDGSCKNGLVSL